MHTTYSWSIWMIWKESLWRPLWLSWLGLLAALFVGFSSHSLRPAARVELSVSIQVVFVSVIATMALLWVAQKDAKFVVGRLATVDECFDTKLIRFWLRLRALAVALEAGIVSVIGTMSGSALNEWGLPPTIDWFFSGIFAVLAGVLVLVILLSHQARIPFHLDRVELPHSPRTTGSIKT